MPAALLLAAALAPLAIASTPPDLAGPWALEMAVVSAARVPVVGDVKSTSRTWILLEVGPDGAGGLVQDHRVCAAEVKGGLVHTRVPARFVAAIPPKRYPVRLLAQGTGWSFAADTGAYAMGFDTACSATVPVEQGDPCVRDADGDGIPGATIHAKAPAFPWVEVYIAQRMHPLLDGAVVSPDRVEGGIQLEVMDTRVLGASNRLFASSPTVTPLPAESRFQMERLSEASCEAVLAHFGAAAPL
ncbi:hypothetical protein L6R53_20115 [Myxococcota bacterium]|nr:hypothetical protein [Myxococcota bacterium]